MATNEFRRPLSRRDVLIGTGAVISSAGASGAAVSPTPARTSPRFDAQAFVEDCRRASEGTADAQRNVQEIFARAIADPAAVLAGVGAPQKGGIQTLYRSASLTILNIVWAPLMQLMPHEHNMWSLFGIYTGREDNIFWERGGGRLAATRAAALSEGDILSLPHDVIHSVTNPSEKLTGAIHIYGGDFFATPRSEWNPETLAEREWNIQSAVRIFEQSNERFLAWRDRKACE